MKILIMKFRNIGDVLLTSPVISHLKNFYPESSIDVAVNQGTESMVSGNPSVNRVVAYDRSAIKSKSGLVKWLKELQFLLSFRKAKYDLVINLTEGDRGAQIALLSGAKIRVGYRNKNTLFKKAYTHHLPSPYLQHTVEDNLDALRVLNIPIQHKKVEIFWQAEDDELVEKKLEKVERFIHIHPVSRWLFKCIADQSMAEIIDYCELELGLKVVITAAPVGQEMKKVNAILDLCQSYPINLSGELSLQQTAALNKKAQLFIGVDTAIMHLSAANNIPVLAFFGPSGAFHWGPWDNNSMQSEYNSRNGVQSMGMHQVISEARPCQPCGKDGCNGSKISECLMGIDFELMEDKISLLLNLRQ